MASDLLRLLQQMKADADGHHLAISNLEKEHHRVARQLADVLESNHHLSDEISDIERKLLAKAQTVHALSD